MTLSLAPLRASFEGVIPSAIATVSADGTPNISYLSQVHYVDETHVALSNQFFGKTAANVRGSGRATVLVVDGLSGDQHLLDLVFEGSVSDGEVFERMAGHLKALSSQHGMENVMALRSADLFRVEAIRPVPRLTDEPSDTPPPRSLPGGERLAAAARLAQAVAAQADAETMVEQALAGLARDFDVAHAMILTPDADGARLSTLASLGYQAQGAGSQVEVGQGVIGIAASSLKPVRVSDMSRGERFAAAVRATAELDVRTIPLPGLPRPQSQIAAPMVSQGRLRGVIFAESAERFAFTHEDEDAFALVGAQLAASLRLAELEAQAAEAITSPSPPPAVPPAGQSFRVKHFAFDDSLFIDDTYVIKGVPGRLLFRFLSLYAAEGRTEFTNREVRLDAALRLPDLKDNLETRLILLKRRLDEKACPVRITRPARGRIRLELDGVPALESVPG